MGGGTEGKEEAEKLWSDILKCSMTTEVQNNSIIFYFEFYYSSLIFSTNEPLMC